jgi:ABC-2 type transport system ATP-binding protein
MTIPSVLDGAPDVVNLRGVAKRFVLRKDNSLKERLVTLGRLGRKHREEFWALRNVDLTIPAGSTIGLIGHNGSGKSTLLKVIGGIIGPTNGTVESRGRIAALLELGAGFHPDLTGKENVYLNASILGMSRKETDARFAEILAYAGIGEFIDTQVKFYSSGMYVRLAFAVAVHTDPDILLVDEVLSVGDEAFQRKCLDTIRRFQQEGRTIVLVSHSLGQIQEFCDHVVLLDRGNVAYEGNAREAIARFRTILEDRRVELETPVQAKPAGPAIESVTVFDARSGEPVSSGSPIEPGRDLRIDVVVADDSGPESWMLGIQVNNVHGQSVFGVGSDLLGAHLPPIRGRQRISVTLDAPMFGAGKYFVDASVLAPDGTHLTDMPQATSFDVVAEDVARGSLFVRARMDVHPIA